MTTELDLLKSIVLSCYNKKNVSGHVDSVIEDAVEFCNRIPPHRKDRLMLNGTLMNIGEIVGKGKILPSLRLLNRVGLESD